MQLRGIEFGNVLGASGVQRFFGEGYWFHRLPFWKPDFTGMTFVSKTATLYPREGNVRKGIKERFFPSWAKTKFSSGHTLNAMGLPNPGIRALLQTGKWQQQSSPLFVSVMSVQDSMEKRMDELRYIIDTIDEYKNLFYSPFGLQINLSCPNTSLHSTKDLVSESAKVCDVAGRLSVPIMLKYAIDTAATKTVMELHGHPNCDAICVSNTLKFGWKKINWKEIWGTDVSPLAHLGGGGLSGPALLPHVCRWIQELRELGFKKPINGGGGIFCKEDVAKYHQAGASSVFIGTVAMHHPRRVAGIIQHANTLTWRKS